MKHINWLRLVYSVSVLLWVAGGVTYFANADQVQIQSNPINLEAKIAPGEALPFAVKLINFGTRKRVDVGVRYQVSDMAGHEIVSEQETVAVDTTATLLKRLSLPASLAPGRYTLTALLDPQTQPVSALASFQFVVESKILGVYQSDFLRYALLAFALNVFLLLVVELIWYHRKNHYLPHDYSHHLASRRIYYEMIDSLLTQMRFQVGDKAFELANSLPDLAVDATTGRVVEIAGEPARAVVELVAKYEAFMGRGKNH
jgi:hypothetical protein